MTLRTLCTRVFPALLFGALCLLWSGCPTALTPCDEEGKCAEGRLCRDGLCQRRKACASDVQCEPGQRCVQEEGLCKLGCETDDRCPTGQSCYLDQCKAAVCGPRANKPMVEPCYSGDEAQVAQAIIVGGGQCSKGERHCIDGGQAWSRCYGETKAANEICDGADNDCNGKVDELPECQKGCPLGEFRICQTSPPGTNIAKPYTGSRCMPGIQYCKPTPQDKTKGAWGPCLKERRANFEKALTDVCALVDVDCDGQRDEFRFDQRPCTCPKEGAKEACYVGPKGTAGVGQCKFGERACQFACKQQVNKIEDCPQESRYLRWTECAKSVLPVPEEGEDCNGKDDDCDGQTDNRSDEAGKNVPLARPCYPSGNVGCDAQGNCKGACARGIETCEAGIWSLCKGAVTPAATETCNGKDDNCNGTVDEGLPNCQP